MSDVKMINFKFSSRGDIAHQLFNKFYKESKDREAEWEPINGPEVYKVATGPCFEEISSTLQKVFHTAFPELSPNPNFTYEEGMAYNELVDPQEPDCTTYNLVSLWSGWNGPGGEVVQVSVYKGIDFRNMDNEDGTIEFSISGWLSSPNLKRLYQLMKENAFLKNIDFDFASAK